MGDIFLLDNIDCRWLSTPLKENGKGPRQPKVGYNTYPPNTQKYSIVTESMDILTPCV
jgi:hypothetical protein